MGKAGPRALVLDTNIVLDLLLFRDPATQGLRQAIESGDLVWLATDAMREEFVRVLDYPQLRTRRAYHGLESESLASAFDGLSKRVFAPSKADITCTDPDDQKFIDLAVAHEAVLLSKDEAVLRMKKRCAQRGASVLSVWNEHTDRTGDGARADATTSPTSPTSPTSAMSALSADRQ